MPSVRRSATAEYWCSFHDCAPVSGHNVASLPREGAVGKATARFDAARFYVGVVSQLETEIHPGIRIGDARQEDPGQKLCAMIDQMGVLSAGKRILFVTGGPVGFGFAYKAMREQCLVGDTLGESVDALRSVDPHRNVPLVMSIYRRRRMYCRIRNLLQFGGTGREADIRPFSLSKILIRKVSP